jgi:hypothetical protein
MIVAVSALAQGQHVRFGAAHEQPASGRAAPAAPRCTPVADRVG